MTSVQAPKRTLSETGLISKCKRLNDECNRLQICIVGSMIYGVAITTILYFLKQFFLHLIFEE